MKETHHFLYLGLSISLLLHLSVFYTVFWHTRFLDPKDYRSPTRVAVQVVQKPVEKPLDKVAFTPPKPPEAIKPLPLPVEKPKVKKAVKPKKIKPAAVPPTPIPKVKRPPKKTPLPVSNTPNADSPEGRDVKPVFGMNRDSIGKSGTSGMSVRVGNTLMQAQEEEYTPPEEVKAYTVVPPFELSSSPSYKTRVEPDYPPSLRNRDVEGEVLLSATIDENGRVVAVKVKRSDDELFSQAAVKAVKQFTFIPGRKNGKPVATTIDIPIKFILDK